MNLGIDEAGRGPWAGPLVVGAAVLGGVQIEGLTDTPKDEEIILYCVSGSRSNVVGHILRQFGFTNITNGINQGQVERKLCG